MDGKICPRYPALSDDRDCMDNLSSEECQLLSILSDSRCGDAGIHCSVGSGEYGRDKKNSAECPICMNNYFAVCTPTLL